MARGAKVIDYESLESLWLDCLDFHLIHRPVDVSGDARCEIESLYKEERVSTIDFLNFSFVSFERLKKIGPFNYL